MERSVEQKSMDGFCIQPFDAVPDFTLESVVDGFAEKFTLSSLAGKGKYIVLLFYPVDFGYVTPTEFYQLNDLMDEFKGLEAEVLAISTEHVPSLIKYSEAPRVISGLDHMKIRLISDPLAEVCTKFGIYKQEENIAFTSIAIIDKDMKLISKESYDLPVGCNFKNTLEMLKAHDCKCNNEENGSQFCEIDCCLKK